MKADAKWLLIGRRDFSFKDRRTGEQVVGETGVFLAQDGSGDVVELGLPKDHGLAASDKPVEVEVELDVRQYRPREGSKQNRLRILKITAAVVGERLRSAG